MTKCRVYISIYFEDAKLHGKKKGDVTIAFGPDDELYKKVKALGSAEIKRITGINTYKGLLEAAKRDDRSSSNYIKHKLRVYFENE